MSVTDRLSARLAKYSQQNTYGSALRMTSLNAPPRVPSYHKVQDQLQQVPHTTSSILSSVGGSTLNNGSTMPAHLNPSIQVLSNQVVDGGNAVNEANRELAQTRSRLYTQERQLANFEAQLRQKDDAMRKVIQESAGEKNALVEALQEARQKADGLQIELSHKGELLEKAEYQLSSFKQEFVQLQEKYVRQSKELGELKHGQQHYKDAQNIYQVKNNILTEENNKLTAQVDELQNVELENKVLKQNLAQLEHEFASISAKYEKETKASTDLRATLTTLKQEYSEVLRKFADSQDDYNNVKQLKLKYEELCKQHSDVSESFRNLSDKYAELDSRARRDEESLQLERQAISALSQIFTDLVQTASGAPDPSAGDLEKLNSKLNNVQLSTAYQKLLPVISKVRSTISLSHANSGQLKSIESAHQTSQKELATALAKVSELQLQLDAAETSNTRLKETLDTRDSELQQRLVTCQRTEQDLQKVQLALKLQLGQLQSILQQASAATIQTANNMQSTSTSPGTIPVLPSNVIASVQTASKIKPDADNLQEITAAILALHSTRTQQLEQAAMDCQRLSTELTTLQVANEQQMNNIKTLEDQNIRLKQQINGHETRQVQDQQQISQFKTQQANLAQFIQVLLQSTNQSDLRINKLVQQSGIANQIISNYLAEQHLISVENQTKAQRARSKLLKIYYAGVFMFKLKRYAKWYKEQLQSQPKAFKDRTNDQAENLLNQCNQMIAPIVHQTGDVKAGLITLQYKEQRELINRVLSNFLQSGSTIHYFTGAPINARTGQFRFFSECFNKIQREEKLARDKIQLQLNELNKQNSVLQISIDEYKKELDSVTQAGRQKDQDIIRLKQGIESYYIEKREYDTLAYAKQDLEQKIQLISEQSQDKTRQITSMEVDIQTFQNEITRLNDQLQQNDKLVKNLTNKYDSQVSSQEQLKDLVLNYEGQLKQKQNRIEELEIKSAEDRLSKQTIQKTLDNNIQQMSDLRTQLEQRDKLITDLQLQIEKENRLRVISEHQLIKEKEKQGGAYKDFLPASASQSIVPSAVPAGVNILKPSIPKLQATTYDSQSNIKNLINQLNNLD